MVRFYSLTPDQIKDLDARTAGQMWQAIRPLEAQELLNQIMVSSYPHMETGKRKETLKNLQKQAKIDFGEKRNKDVSNEDVARWLRGALGG